jgi:transposase-like protein
MNNAHRRARTTPHGRGLLVRRIEEEGWTAARVAEAFGVSERTVRKWRYFRTQLCARVGQGGPPRLPLRRCLLSTVRAHPSLRQL